MKILSFTPTHHFTRAIQPGTEPLANRAFFFRREIINFFGLARAASLLAFAPVGAIQLKEATIENKGRDILSSKTIPQFYSIGVFDHEK